MHVFLFYYRKAFDFTDHGTLAAKLRVVGVPNSIINWTLNFLSDRSQRVKLNRDCMSEWGAVPAGVPQGTKLGPWLFLLIDQRPLNPQCVLWDVEARGRYHPVRKSTEGATK